MDYALYKTPRLYYPQDLKSGGHIRLEGAAHHYLRNVMRQEEGALIRVFNTDQGEFKARINAVHKKYCEAALQEALRPPYDAAADRPHITLAFPPLPKDRMDMVIEKAVELGAHALQPLLYAHSSVRKIKPARLEAQIIEAAEQCERLDIPQLHELTSLDAFLRQCDTPIIAAVERSEAPSVQQVLGSLKSPRSLTYIIGPEGGFSDEECAAFKGAKSVHSVSLGPRILRTETAAFYGLSLISSLSRIHSLTS